MREDSEVFHFWDLKTSRIFSSLKITSSSHIGAEALLFSNTRLQFKIRKYPTLPPPPIDVKWDCEKLWTFSIRNPRVQPFSLLFRSLTLCIDSGIWTKIKHPLIWADMLKNFRAFSFIKALGLGNILRSVSEVLSKAKYESFYDFGLGKIRSFPPTLRTQDFEKSRGLPLYRVHRTWNSSKSYIQWDSETFRALHISNIVCRRSSERSKMRVITLYLYP